MSGTPQIFFRDTPTDQYIKKLRMSWTYPEQLEFVEFYSEPKNKFSHNPATREIIVERQKERISNQNMRSTFKVKADTLSGTYTMGTGTYEIEYFDGTIITGSLNNPISDRFTVVDSLPNFTNNLKLAISNGIIYDTSVGEDYYIKSAVSLLNPDPIIKTGQIIEYHIPDSYEAIAMSIPTMANTAPLRYEWTSKAGARGIASPAQMTKHTHMVSSVPTANRIGWIISTESVGLATGDSFASIKAHLGTYEPNIVENVRDSYHNSIPGYILGRLLPGESNATITVKNYAENPD